MKVPKMYKSSDRYNAGVDVIYNDESKLQYAPFIYAAAESGDNGDSGGDDEEGEDTMVIKFDAVNDHYDKTWQEIFDAVKSGKPVICVLDYSPAEAPDTYYGVYYVNAVGYNENAPDASKYGVYMFSHDGNDVVVKIIACASPSDYLVDNTPGE